MTTFPGSPRLIKGALVGIDPLNPLAGIIVFQYNPETMTRRLEARTAGGEGDPGEATRLSGPPRETITVSIEIDAADQLEQGDTAAATLGIHPALAALEVMLYPKSAMVVANTALSLLGTIEILPMEGPFVLFVWGPQRVLPVRLTGFSITEEAYDPLLNPIRAQVELSMNVLSYQDLSVLHPGHSLSLAHQVAKEVLATTNTGNNAQNIIAGLQL
ncbi:hypothetical protein FKG94_06995 [Exilibacterium tricleocarpae]|uniref:Uncharacterized protein n=1 Tax=Exilibacterium tricleocarpae TaxID=2591008 RepID=A0A545TZ33_9GAMM|nr:hypothetical protein [Exilibacterium tricleocarpae]TQV82482.1 hypothetical protein FKG94_06995 [Exilibacterium tricleocarpae]